MAKVILIVEDDPNSRMLARDLLQRFGYAIIEATDGKQGVELAKARKPDLILMDIMMPGMDGYTACYAIRTDEATREIPVVMLTGLGQELNMKLAKAMGASGYVTKPFNLQDLLEATRQFLPAS